MANNADPATHRIGNFEICMDVTDGDLQIRVYPVTNGQVWDCPVDVFDVAAEDCTIEQEADDAPDHAPRFEVHMWTMCGGWENVWQEDDQPQTFASEAEAQAEIDDFLADIAAEIASGDRAEDEGYDADDFRIVPAGTAPEPAPEDSTEPEQKAVEFATPPSRWPHGL